MGSGEIPHSDDEWEDIDDAVDEIGGAMNQQLLRDSPQKLLAARRRNSLICPIYNEAYKPSSTPHSHLSTMERQTQTEPPKKPKWKQIWLCFLGDDKFRRQRHKEAISKSPRGHSNIKSRKVFLQNFLRWDLWGFNIVEL